MLQFGQKSIESKDFYKNKRITDTVDHDKIVVSKSILAMKGKISAIQSGMKMATK